MWQGCTRLLENRVNANGLPPGLIPTHRQMRRHLKFILDVWQRKACQYIVRRNAGLRQLDAPELPSHVICWFDSGTTPASVRAMNRFSACVWWGLSWLLFMVLPIQSLEMMTIFKLVQTPESGMLTIDGNGIECRECKCDTTRGWLVHVLK